MKKEKTLIINELLKIVSNAYILLGTEKASYSYNNRETLRKEGFIKRGGFHKKSTVCIGLFMQRITQ